jgi:hypothetical protein
MTAVPVARLSPIVVDTCPCGSEAAWQVGLSRRSCTPCVGKTLEALYAADPRPFVPHLPVPLRRVS